MGSAPCPFRAIARKDSYDDAGGNRVYEMYVSIQGQMLGLCFLVC